MKKILALCVFFVAGAVTSVSFGQSGAFQYAQRMNSGGFFRHDRSFNGAEVIYRSSGTATEADAMRWWMNSPPHRRLVQSGQITDIQCVGGVCVGRSGGTSSYNYNSTTTSNYSYSGSGAGGRARGFLRRLGR